MVRIKLRTKLLRSTTVYMFVCTFPCVYAKSLLLMLFNGIQCWSTERSGCTLTFTDVENVCTICLTVVFNSIHIQVHGFKWTHEGIPQTKSRGNGCVNIIVLIFWLHCSYSKESGQYSQPSVSWNVCFLTATGLTKLCWNNPGLLQCTSYHFIIEA